jgi:hypothetical protein
LLLLEVVDRRLKQFNLDNIVCGLNLIDKRDYRHTSQLKKLLASAVVIIDVHLLPLLVRWWWQHILLRLTCRSIGEPLEYLLIIVLQHIQALDESSLASSVFI